MKFSTEQYRELANAIRALTMDAVEQAKSGHPGMPMGMADVASVLFAEFLRYAPRDPKWPNRDRFILSAGHGSMLIYALLYLTGYEDITLDDIKKFRQLGSHAAGHPEYGTFHGVETTTGPLGQGFANAVGMAISERMLHSEFAEIDHYTYVIAGDGCLMEGITHEAASLAGHLKLNKLIVLFDDNQISIDGPTSLTVSEDTIARFLAYGWNIIAIDGHNVSAIREALSRAQQSSKPTLIACRTIIGYGAPNKSGKSSAHGSPLGGDEVIAAKAALGWTHPPFTIPEELLKKWRQIGQTNDEIYNQWLNSTTGEIATRLRTELPDGWQKPLAELKNQWLTNHPKIATREASGKVLELLTSTMNLLVGGSADLTGSNLTKTGATAPLSAENYAGRYIYYGVREHGMAAIMNGIALYGGFIPYGGTFLVFADYCRPGIRLSALMEQRVIYVMTHDSIGLGEDGPTHQPVEHLSSLRAIPNLQVLRPADAVETLECWEIALETTKGPTLLALSRQALPALRTEQTENLSKRGAYIIHECQAQPEVTIFASGSELAIAVETAKELSHIAIRVVSMVSMELFDRQSPDYIANLLDNSSHKIAIEAGNSQSWWKYIGRNGKFIGMNNFGASGPAAQLFEHFGITKSNLMSQIKNLTAK